jgi:tetratricopeptide (TPR) repeat protein
MSHRILLLLLLLTSSVRAGEEAVKITTAGIAEFNAAYQAWDAGRFARAAGLFRQAGTNAPDLVTPFYWQGAAEFHRLLCLQHRPGAETNRAAVNAALDAALDALRTAVKLDPAHAESHALLGTLYGMKIDGNLVRAVRLGPRVSKHRKQALALGAENPRVQYLLGTCLFHTAKKPAAWREALEAFVRAEELFAAESRQPPVALEPRWGRSTCLTFLGRTHEHLGDRDRAAEFYRRALEMHPADHLARTGLMRVTTPD